MVIPTILFDHRPGTFGHRYDTFDILYTLALVRNETSGGGRG